VPDPGDGLVRLVAGLVARERREGQHDRDGAQDRGQLQDRGDHRRVIGRSARNLPPSREIWTQVSSRRVSIVVDPPSLLADGELYARALPESAQGGSATLAGALTVAAYWGAAGAFWFDHPSAAPLRKALGYRSGREFMLRFPLPERSRREQRRSRVRDDVIAVAVIASYPLWLWLGWDHGRRARPRGG
jgi:hypothetical protein